MSSIAAMKAAVTPSEPKVGPADGPGEPEEVGYEKEAETMADGLFEALGDEFESSGVEPLVEEVGSRPAEESGSPATPIPEPGAPVDAAKTEGPQTAAQVTQEAPATVATPAVQAQPVPVQAAPQQAAPAQAQPVTSEEKKAPPPGPESGAQFLDHVRQELGKERDIYTQALAQHYSMSEDEAAEVLTSPEKVLPQLAAKVHLEVVQAVLGTLSQALPGVVMGVQSAQQQHSELIGKFFEAWPTLDRSADVGTVTELARVYRAQNPGASFDDMVKNVGAMAVVKLGKLPQAQAAPVAAQPASAPYQPASRAPMIPQPAQQETSPWAAYAELLDE